MKIMGFADQADRSCIGIDHSVERCVIFGRMPGAFGHAKGCEGGAELGLAVEPGAVDRIGTGPPAFNVIDAKRV